MAFVHLGMHNFIGFNTQSHQKTRSLNFRSLEENLGRSSIMTHGDRSSTSTIFTSGVFQAQTFETPEEPKTWSPKVNQDHTSMETCGRRSSTLGVFLWEIFTLNIWNSQSIDLWRESGPFIGHDTRQHIIHFRDFPLGDFYASHSKLPKTIILKRIWTIHQSRHVATDHSLQRFSFGRFFMFHIQNTWIPKVRSESGPLISSQQESSILVVGKYHPLS